MGTLLRGLAWDHRRCWGPLDASVAPYRAAHPDVEIVWDRRSLYEFGEGRIEDVLARYDLVVFDHPFVGDVAARGLMLPFDPYLPDEERRRFEADSVGGSWPSYAAHGKQWALPIDAAAQVASCRPDLFSAYADRFPTSHDEVVALGRRLRADGKWIGLPMVPTDAMCLVLTLAAGAGDPIGEGGRFLARAAVERIVAQLRELAALSHPRSAEWNPIRCYDHMVATDEVVYVPYAFGYVNYAARAEAPHLRFGDIPHPEARGALLGGAGIGISAFSAAPRAAAEYALFLCSADYQRGDYVIHGGQPGSRAAWTDAAANAATRNFFRDTLATLDRSYLRPTHAGFIDFFRDATHRAAAAIAGELAPAAFADWLDARYRVSLVPAEPAESPA
ncbi:extracellular solute-binding protein [Prosthecomicrobium pneumaticum]|uniref:Multiple sugar transport system substrate-binding protein n=1 Tax=Prosthecomicrobium pneumaticum TaxID=81895 RepID=A0A7W9FN78_9HYPH|nr:extracellular solute-binding protein [Prosthecomicrobium pneumaticum]MBB5753750.1 multiple sugar transport system substrate-binding protein [Prosthecomicrobium pneumaticum]